jgi:3-deoxy-D-manno-octulosonic acid kinase
MFERQPIDRGAILFDPRRVPAPGPALFDPQALRARGSVTEARGGRGSILFLEIDGSSWVLRRYLRGGMATHVVRDLYLWLGEERTRSFRELRLLGELRRRGLPVPAPVAARYRRRWLGYRAELITERLPGVQSLSAWLASGRMTDARWTAVGRCLRRFHDAGVQHADLNSDNIQIDAAGEVWVLDFDRGRLREPGHWSQRVLNRLARSIAKRNPGLTGWQDGFARLRLAHDA